MDMKERQARVKEMIAERERKKEGTIWWSICKFKEKATFWELLYFTFGTLFVCLCGLVLIGILFGTFAEIYFGFVSLEEVIVGWGMAAVFIAAIIYISKEFRSK